MKLALPAALGALLLIGCAEDPPTPAPAAASIGEPSDSAQTPAVAGTTNPDGKSSEPDPGPPPKVEIVEAELTESERSRDPFRSFVDVVKAEGQGAAKSQRDVVLSQFSIDELKLIGIVTRAEPAKAMLVDPGGMGHVVRRGQFVGKPDIVQAAGRTGASYEINWRVDRIRDGDIVLIREDPQNPDVPSATRVIPLRPEGSEVK